MSTWHAGLPDAGADREVGLGSGRLGLPHRRRAEQRRRLRLGEPAGACRRRSRRGRRSAAAGTTSSRTRTRCPFPTTARLSSSTSTTVSASAPGASATPATRTSTATSRTSTTGPARRSSGSAIRPAALARRPATPGYLGADDYVLPARGTLTRLTPLITWKPLAGHQSYFVIVSKDANFSNLADYAFTQVPAYSPRSQIRPTTYSDETTLYYWAVLPATGSTGAARSATHCRRPPRTSRSSRCRRRR